VHADALRELASAAENAEREGRTADATAAWERALALLPDDSRQHTAIQDRLAARPSVAPPVSAPSQTSATNRGRWKTISAAASMTALLLWKLKFVAGFLLTKGKLLALGLTKSSTLLSMLASLGVYWAAWGIWFALGFVLSIYVHEMGHVAALRRYGVPATAPMFIPGVGAFIRAHRMPSSLYAQAQIGLAGPLWGLGAAVAAAAAYYLTGNGLWAAIARTGALINVFNLVPVWQLDGSRAFAAFSRADRWLAVLALGAVWVATREGMFVLVLLVAAGRALIGQAPADHDRRSLALYAALTVAFAMVARI
jgi:Zn-dependent protease